MTVNESCAGYEQSRQHLDHLFLVVKEIYPTEPYVTRSQIAFRDRKAFSWVWIPALYLRWVVAPLVLTLVISHRDASPRWKDIARLSPGNFTHKGCLIEWIGQRS